MKQFTTLSEAAQHAVTICSRWRFAYSDERYDIRSLPVIAEVHDVESFLDEDSFYLVSSGGAIGFCPDGEEIDWMFLPLNDAEEALPTSFSMESQGNLCPQCGGPLNEGARFCGGCGRKL